MSAAAIAVAVDGSTSSGAALLAGKRLAAEQGRPLRGIFVLDDGWVDYIGNDWQSSAGARQGFLDYVRDKLLIQADLARRQFEAAAADCADASFAVICGDPLTALRDLMQKEAPAALVLAADAFRDCGRPSVRRLAKELMRLTRHSIVIV